MTKTSRESDGESPQPPKQTAILLLGDIADATWRMFLPSIGLTLLGLWADNQLGTSPWLMIAGIVVGTALATLLIVRMLKKLS